ncbi:MAG: hypothetical protein A2X36_07685 [Elusimicrobia bacterium GWA2_69_24]|nr:MAG: hypothetical protein A2X36_07685 [Elusimicrobia bacterium GWA2_69_24]HBL17683.1 hypothetical protein [Elusimicrobiota bacterium]
MINIIIITHGEFGAYLVEAAEGIVGPQDGGVLCVGISARMSVVEVRGRLSEALERVRGKGEMIVVTDMPGGTPANVAIPLLKDRPEVPVISGVNLYMLVTAFNYRKTAATASELAEKMLSAGQRAVSNIRVLLAGRA